MDAVTANATTTGGFWAQSFHVPRDFDRDRDAFIVITLIKAAGLAPITALNVLIRTEISITDPSFTVVPLTFDNVITIPASWQAGSWLTFLAGNPNPTFPAHSLPDQAILGYKIRRFGADPLDTYTIGIGFLTTTALRYNRLCAFTDCPP